MRWLIQQNLTGSVSVYQEALATARSPAAGSVLSTIWPSGHVSNLLYVVRISPPPLAPSLPTVRGMLICRGIPAAPPPPAGHLPRVGA
jgi:hypothetical protein